MSTEGLNRLIGGYVGELERLLERKDQAGSYAHLKTRNLEKNMPVSLGYIKYEESKQLQDTTFIRECGFSKPY